MVHGHPEGQARRIVSHDERRPDRQIASRANAVKINDWPLRLHESAQPGVVGVAGIASKIAIVQQLRLLVEAVPVGIVRRRPDGNRHLHLPRLPDASLADERDLLTLELEPVD